MFSVVRRGLTDLTRKFNYGYGRRRCHNSPTEGKNKMQVVRHKTAKALRGYAILKYLNYIQNYDKILERRFPRAMTVYRVFSIGVKDFYQDTKEFVRVVGVSRNAKKAGNAIHSLPRKDVEILYRMPRAMLKVAPVLLISALPLANYVIFPLAYLFPKKLLCSHFWSLQQRYDFALQDHRKAIAYYQITFRCLQARIDSVCDTDLRSKLTSILSKLASGVHPSVEEIIAIKELFHGEPFHLNCLYPRHKNSLLHIYGMHILWSRRKRLLGKAEEIFNLDRTIEREGVLSLTSDDLRWACFTRGLNPSNMRTEDMTDWLNQWISVTKHVDSSTYSLLLHCPILLAYNHPTNRILMH